MIKINIYNQQAEKVAEKSVSSRVFGVTVNEALVHQAVVAQMGNERQVLAHTKVRSEVRGGGKKPWRQKGTGRARVGSSRSPIWIGGGVVFGPRKDRNFSKDINKKMRQKAIFMALSDRTANNSLIVLDTLDIAQYKTKIFDGILKNIETKVLGITDKRLKRSILVLNDSQTPETKFSARNLKGVEIANLSNINILDLLKNKVIILSQEAIVKLEKQYK